MIRSFRTLTCVALVATVLVTIDSTEAAEENFTGYSGSLFGENAGSTTGGIAWTGTWGDQGFASSPNVITGFGNIGTINTVSSTDPYVEYPLDNTQGGINVPEGTRGFTSQSNQSSVFVYGLVAVGNPIASSFGGIGLFDASEKFLIGKRFGSNNWGVGTNNLNGAGQDSGVPIGNFSTALLAAKIDQVSNQLTFWVDPDFSQTEAANTAEFTLNYGANSDTIDNVRLRAGDAGSNETWQWDNINVTQLSPFASPPPSLTPEPSSLLLSGLALAFFLGGVRRHRRR